MRSIAAVLALSVGVLSSCTSTVDQNQPVPVPSDVSIVGPAEVLAGEPYDVDVHSARSDMASLAVDAGYGPQTLQAPVVDGVAEFAIPASAVAGSGVVRLDARVGTARATTTIEVVPADPVDPLELFLGPRTVVADGKDFSMIVVAPVDRFGNPVADGTDIAFRMNRPSGRSDETASTDGLLASLPIVGGTVAGRTSVAATIGPIAGAEQSFLQVAGPAEPFALSVSDAIPAADGSTLIEIETDTLADSFGNELPDGILVTIDVRTEHGDGRLWASTIDGAAAFVLEAPDRPGTVELTAFTSGGVSEPLVLEFAAAVADVPVAVRESDQAGPRWEIVIGPVLARNGAYVADGTVARIDIDGQLTELGLEEGHGSLRVPDEPTNLSVRVLGVAAADIDTTEP